LGPIYQNGPRRSFLAYRGLRRALAIAVLLGLVFSYLGAQAAHADTVPACASADLTQLPLLVRVTGLRSVDGDITITVYPNDASHFLDGKYKVARQEVPVTLPVTTACFLLPLSSDYAVALFHDENGNHHLDTNSLGIPTEGFGFSNNPAIYFGPPDLSRVRFSLHPGENTVTIRMKYP
jgi:uncharacterized protein (DUF2141 family)